MDLLLATGYSYGPSVFAASNIAYYAQHGADGLCVNRHAAWTLVLGTVVAGLAFATTFRHHRGFVRALTLFAAFSMTMHFVYVSFSAQAAAMMITTATGFVLAMRFAVPHKHHRSNAVADAALIATIGFIAYMITTVSEAIHKRTYTSFSCGTASSSQAYLGLIGAALLHASLFAPLLRSRTMPLVAVLAIVPITIQTALPDRLWVPSAVHEALVDIYNAGPGTYDTAVLTIQTMLHMCSSLVIAHQTFHEYIHHSSKFVEEWAVALLCAAPVAAMLSAFEITTLASVYFGVGLLSTLSVLW